MTKVEFTNVALTKVILYAVVLTKEALLKVTFWNVTFRRVVFTISLKTGATGTRLYATIFTSSGLASLTVGRITSCGVPSETSKYMYSVRLPRVALTNVKFTQVLLIAVRFVNVLL